MLFQGDAAYESQTFSEKARRYSDLPEPDVLNFCKMAYGAVEFIADEFYWKNVQFGLKPILLEESCSTILLKAAPITKTFVFWPQPLQMQRG